MKEKEFWALDWLRFTLSVYLVLYHTLNGHYQPLGGTWVEATLDLGNMATTVFFVLSGFLLTHVYVVLKDAQPMNKKSFYVARFSSLYPLHIVGLLLALIPTLLTIYARGGISVPTGPLDSDVRMLEQSEVLFAIVSNVVLLNAWNPYYLILNGPSWSLSALACYYALFPFIAPKLYRMKSPALGLVALGVVFSLPGLIADALHRTDLFTNGFLHHNPLIRLPLFIAGMVLCVLFSRIRNAAQGRQQFVLLGLVVVATFTGATYLRLQGLHHFHTIKNGLYLPAALALVWLCACTSTSASTKVKYWGARLGSASLPMFLLHVPVFQLFSKIEKMTIGLLHAGSNASLASVISSGHGIHQTLPAYPVYIISLIILCILLQEKFVVPTQAKIRRYFASGNARRTAPNGIVARINASELAEHAPLPGEALK